VGIIEAGFFDVSLLLTASDPGSESEPATELKSNDVLIFVDNDKYSMFLISRHGYDYLQILMNHLVGPKK